MSTFRYFAGLQEDVSGMISEVGTSCSIRVPVHVVDSMGNHVSTTWTTYTEVVWVRSLGEVMDVEDIGQLNREDIRFVAAYNTVLVPEAELTYDGDVYTILSLNNGNLTGINTHHVGFGKRKLS